VHDIRAPRLQARLEDLLGDAPLRVVQRWHTRGLRQDCLNDDEKIECTLVANTYRAEGPDAVVSPLLIELLPKRGYERETAALARRLQLPWQALEQDVLHTLDALHLAELAAQQARLPRTRRASAPVAVALVLLEHHATMCASAQAGGSAPAVEALHDFRVAMRRTRSLLRAFRDVLGGELEGHFSSEFRWLARATSHLRDIDVLADALAVPNADYAELASEDRACLAALLARERARHAQDLEQVLASTRYARLRRQWPAALAAVVHHPDSDAPRIEAASSSAIRRALARVRRDVAAVESECTPAALHELRKQCKRLRYLIEPFASLYPRARIADAQNQLKRLQTMMGEICDRHAQLALLHGPLWRRAKGDGPLRAALKRARILLRGRLATSDVEAVLTALAEFDSRRHHAALDALFQAHEP
jgi:CHAD domain-containing protein